MDQRPALRLVGVSRTYGTPENPVHALRNATLTLAPATFTAVMGPSGSGKSTLLHCAAGLDQPSGGEVFIDGTPLTHGTETAMTKFRRSRVGFVFQQFNLLPTLTVWQNTTLPLRLAGKKIDDTFVREVLVRTGLGDRLDHRPPELSGGQQQRVAIARALVARPHLIFADEPTGALDTHTASEVLALLADAVHVLGQTVVMVTHDPVAAAYADSVVFLADGRIVDHLHRPSAKDVAELMTHLGARRHTIAAGE
ncbi:ABC transporter ATP-binding protein [Amycolatopsis sp. 195334CR]|uniref:ABC transporter ATP-binding protein n=1 Tax=Amycolatopsis sp. 195334CR TaxID=2814588 RepID=UPI001A8EF2FF|nr:ABC transporter ATP-binding protein [Amycolatopsis sp. 195334CR]MBN6038108.1 ABC transporter ATP-binding protein [Amycolatopsis sp. 195334CR]